MSSVGYILMSSRGDISLDIHDIVDIRLAQTPALPIHIASLPQLSQKVTDSLTPYAQIEGHPLLAGEAAPFLPGVRQENPIGDPGAETEMLVSEDIVRDLSKTLAEGLVLDDDGVLFQNAT